MSQLQSICLHLDKRRMKLDGTYPVKLRIYHSPDRSQKYLNTGISMSEKDYNHLFGSDDLSGEDILLRHDMEKLERQARVIAQHCRPFNMEIFTRRFRKRDAMESNVQHLFSLKISELHDSEQIATAQSYGHSLKSLIGYMEHQSKMRFSELTVFDITPGWLDQYTHYLQDIVGNSQATAGIHIRNLRHVLNRAIDAGYLDKSEYPFGKDKFHIEESNHSHKSITPDQVEALLNTQPKTHEQIKARDFWLLSYYCKGMTMKEIAHLKYEDIHADIVYLKRKRKNNGSRMKQHQVCLNDLAFKIINKYGNLHQFPGNYVFPILSLSDNEEQKFVKVKRFTRFVNQHIKKIADDAAISRGISTDWARQSYIAHSAV